jgi:hypothetical protein
MDEDRVRELLDRYRPVGAPAGLRHRALIGTGNTPRTWPWAVAAAALLAASAGLHLATNRTLARVATPVDGISVDALAATMGGDEDARRAARLIVAEREFRAGMTGPHLAVRTPEELNGVN